jgi:hypothetical protein
VRIDDISITARGPSSSIERINVERRPELVRPNYEYAWESINLVRFRIAVAEPICRARQKHINQVAFEDAAFPLLYLAQGNNFSGSSHGGDVHQVKRVRQRPCVSREIPQLAFRGEPDPPRRMPTTLVSVITQRA